MIHVLPSHFGQNRSCRIDVVIFSVLFLQDYEALYDANEGDEVPQFLKLEDGEDRKSKVSVVLSEVSCVSLSFCVLNNIILQNIKIIFIKSVFI